MGKFIQEDLDSLYYQYRTSLLAYNSGLCTKNIPIDALKRYCRACRKNGVWNYDDYKLKLMNR